MAKTFSTSEYSKLQDAINLMVRGQAVELPFDAQVIERVSKVAASSGFEGSDGRFVEDAKLSPISTLLRFIAYVGKP